MALITPKSDTNAGNILLPATTDNFFWQSQQNDRTLFKKITDFLTGFHAISIEISPMIVSRFIEQSNIENELNHPTLVNTGKNFSFLGLLSLIDTFSIAQEPFLSPEQRRDTFCLESNNLNFNPEQYGRLVSICKQDNKLNSYLTSIAKKEKGVFSLLLHNPDKVANTVIRQTQTFVNGQLTDTSFEKTGDLYGHSIFSDPLTVILSLFTLNALENQTKCSLTEEWPYKETPKKIIFSFSKLLFATLCSFACNRIFLKKEYFFLYIRQYFVMLNNFIEEAFAIGNHLILHYPDLVKKMPTLNHLVLIKNTTFHSKEFNDLLKMLDKNTFKGDGQLTYFCSIGNVKNAHRLFMAARKEIDLIISAIGILQLYRGIGKIEGQTSSNQIDLTKIQDTVIYFHNHTVY